MARLAQDCIRNTRSALWERAPIQSIAILANGVNGRSAASVVEGTQAVSGKSILVAVVRQGSFFGGP